MAQTKTVHTLERARDAFDDIKTALETKTSQSLANVDVENYDDIIDGIDGPYILDNFAYFFFDNCRAPISYWDYVELCGDNIVDVRKMNKSAGFAAGDYNLDLSGVTVNSKIEEAFDDAYTTGIVNIVVKLGSHISSLYKFFKATSAMYPLDEYFNFSFDEDGVYTQVVDLHQAFRGLFGTLDLSEIKDNTFNNLDGAFNNVNVINDFVGIEDFDISNLTSLRETFYAFNSGIADQGNFNKLDFSSWDFSSVQFLNSFLLYSRIKEVEFNSNFTFDGVNLSSLIQANDTITKVSGLEIQDTNYSNIGSEAQMFHECSNLVQVLSSDKWILYNGPHHLFYNCADLETIPDIDLHLAYSYDDKNSAEYMFYGCQSLVNITLNVINASSILLKCNNMFNGCSSLKEVKGDLDLTYLYDSSQLNNLFNGCVALEKINTSGGIGENVNDSALTLDLSASPVFNIEHLITGLATKSVNQVRNIKLHNTVYSNLTQNIIDAATAKGYTLTH